MRPFVDYPCLAYFEKMGREIVAAAICDWTIGPLMVMLLLFVAQRDWIGPWSGALLLFVFYMVFMLALGAPVLLDLSIGGTVAVMACMILLEIAIFIDSLATDRMLQCVLLIGWPCILYLYLSTVP